jgi:hypothetical protein
MRGSIRRVSLDIMANNTYCISCEQILPLTIDNSDDEQSAMEPLDLSIHHKAPLDLSMKIQENRTLEEDEGQYKQSYLEYITPFLEPVSEDECVF